MDLRHSKATLISLGAVDTTGVPAMNQVARFFDADTVQGSANFTFSGTILALTGNMTISAFLTLGATPALSGALRLSNASAINFRNANNNGDLNILSTAGSDTFEFGDSVMPRINIESDDVTLHNLQIIGQSFGERTIITRARALVATPSGQTATATNLIPAGALVIGVTTFVDTLVTGPAGYDIGDGVNTDRWGASSLVAQGQSSDSGDFVSGAVEIFPNANDVVITSDGVDFTGGAISVVVHYIMLNAPTS